MNIAISSFRLRKLALREVDKLVKDLYLTGGEATFSFWSIFLKKCVLLSLTPVWLPTSTLRTAPRLFPHKSNYCIIPWFFSVVPFQDCLQDSLKMPYCGIIEYFYEPLLPAFHVFSLSHFPCYSQIKLCIAPGVYNST